MVSDPDAVLAKLETDFNDGKPIEVLTEGVREAIIKNVKRRMTPQPLKIRADVELTCFSYDGVLHIQVNIPRNASASIAISGHAFNAGKRDVLNTACPWHTLMSACLIFTWLPGVW